MPHLSMDYLANLEARGLDPSLQPLERDAAGDGFFEPGAIRIRTFRCDHYSVTDELAANAFIDASLRVTEQMDAGMIWLNSQNVRHLPAPLVVMKGSGIGRADDDYSFEFYMETKNIALVTDDRPIPKLDQ